MDRMDQFLLGKPKYDLNHPAIKTGFESIDLQTSFYAGGRWHYSDLALAWGRRQ